MVAPLNVPIAGPNGEPLDAGVVLATSQPLHDPIFEPGWNRQRIIDNPVPSVPVGAGSAIHILFKAGTNSAGETVINAAKIHTDIGNPQDLVGLLRHVFGDVMAARIASSIGNGCAVKFGFF